MSRHFFAPVTVTAIPEGPLLVLKGVNDTRAPVPVAVEAFALSMAGILRPLGRFAGSLPVDAAKPVGSIPLANLAADEVLFWRWTGPHGASGSDLHAPKPWKAYDLTAPRISIGTRPGTGTILIDLAAHSLAPFTAIESDQPGRFSDNAFALIPGHPRTITFTQATPGPTPRFTIRDLHSATCAPIPTET